jgi:hypothetical protein
MSQPTIFIASSGNALLLAENLKERLKNLKSKGKPIFSEVWLWSEVMRPGTTVPQILKEYAEKADFAAAVLTRDDLTSKKGVKRLAPRDNCVFEAGFFTGALEKDFERCFLICNVRTASLPTDLQPLQQVRFSGVNLAKPEKCIGANIIRTIRKAVKAKGCVDRRVGAPIVAKDKLLKLERVGANIQKGREIVLVYATEPLEKDRQFARRVMRNMEKRVCYEYYFHGNEERIYGVWDMIQMLSLAGVIPEAVRVEPGEPEALKTLERVAKDPLSKKQVLKNLDTISRQLRVYFLPRVAGIEFCVHNADNRRYAKGYLRYDSDRGGFIEWYKGANGSAIDIAKDVRDRCAKNPRRLIFCSTQGFLLNEEKDFSARLGDAIDDYFPDGLVKQRVEKICFGRRSRDRRNGHIAKAS